MSRLNSWKIAVVLSSSLCLVASAYSAFTGLVYRSDIKGWVTAMNMEDFTAADSFADSLEISEAAFTFAVWPWIATVLFSIVAIIGWTHANAQVAEEIDDSALTHSNGWAIWSWFVPFMNLVRPRRILAESLSIRGHRSLIGLLNAWWVLFILDYLFSQSSGRLLNSAYSETSAVDTGDTSAFIASMSGLSEAVTVDMFSSLFSIAPLVLVIPLVLKASKQGEAFNSISYESEFVLAANGQGNLPEAVAAPMVTVVVDSDYKRCPFCAEEIRAEAIKCKHCGSDIS